MAIKASIIIAVYNRASFIEKCLTAVLNQSLADYEVIVVDDGSTDQTVSIIKKFQDKRLKLIVNEKNSGPAYSRNRGIEAANGEFIAITDSDCVPEKDWLEEIVRPFSLDPKIMITGGRVIDPPPKNYWERINQGSNFIADRDGYIEFAHGCNMAFRKKFLQDNPFDETLKKAAGEEFDLCLRCSNQGFKIYYTDKARVIHYHRSSLKGTLIQHFRYGFFSSYVSLKNGHWQFYRFYFIWLAILVGILTFSLIATGNLPGWKIILLIFITLEVVFIFRTFLQTRQLTWKERWVIFPGYYLVNITQSIAKICYFFNSIKKVLRDS